MISKLPILAALALLQAAAAHAQIPVPPTSQPRITSTNPLNEPFDDLLNRIATAAAQYRAQLPSVTADESIDTWVTPPVAPFKHHVELKATFNVLRQPDTTGLKESRQITQINGKPYVLLEDLPRIPMLFAGGFSSGQSLYFNPELRHCLTFSVAPGLTRDALIQLYFSAQHSAASDPACASIAPGLKGVARVQPLLLQVVHVERTIPTPIALQRKTSAFSAIDYAPIPFGAETLWLPSLIVATMPDATRHFAAQYTHYRLYTPPPPNPAPVGTSAPHK